MAGTPLSLTPDLDDLAGPRIQAPLEGGSLNVQVADTNASPRVYPAEGQAAFLGLRKSRDLLSTPPYDVAGQGNGTNYGASPNAVHNSPSTASEMVCFAMSLMRVSVVNVETMVTSR
jgi:hypothetical protein